MRFGHMRMEYINLVKTSHFYCHLNGTPFRIICNWSNKYGFHAQLSQVVCKPAFPRADTGHPKLVWSKMFDQISYVVFHSTEGGASNNFKNAYLSGKATLIRMSRHFL